MNPIGPREAAYLAALAATKDTEFVADSLEKWARVEKPSSLDQAFANEIACGTVRMALALDYLGEKLTERNALSLKLKERVLLRTALYQHFFLDRVPLYAIVDETLKIAKKYCHPRFCSFLNALLRKAEKKHSTLPTGKDPQALSARHSYPIDFVRQLIKEQGMVLAEEILIAQNASPKLMVRVRNREVLPQSLQTVEGSGECAAVAMEGIDLSQLALSKEIYIQNVTPSVLVADLSKRIACPDTIIDLCASPGGKLIAAHDAFPNAHLFVNDVSENKLVRLQENLKKYGIQATVSCGLAEKFLLEQPGDLIILDVPCSNSGVLNKRPEARWRLDKKALKQLVETQFGLLESAALLLAEDGVIWYMTCSILKDENESLVEEFCKRHSFQIVYSRTILPNLQGWDGGFCALIKKNGI